MYGVVLQLQGVEVLGAECVQVLGLRIFGFRLSGVSGF